MPEPKKTISRQVQDVADSVFSWKWLGKTDLSRIAVIIFWAIVSAIVITVFVANAVIWALASLMCGMLMGFIFGIPKVEQSKHQGGGEYRQRVNTNLEEISDWVTKIIVGISLVQLANIPPVFQSLVEFIANDSEISPGTIGAILVLFAVLGFFTGYLLTRIFLASAFMRADRAASEFQEVLEEMESVTASRERQHAMINVDANSSPRDAILQAWIAVSDELQSKLRDGGHLQADGTVPIVRILREARSHDILDSRQLTIVEYLRELRNLAAHSPDPALSRHDVEKYVSEAESLLRELRQSTPQAD